MSEEKQYITDRLRRYSRACLAERLDPDFAAAVYEAADGIESRDEIIKDLYDFGRLQPEEQETDRDLPGRIYV